ncbi:hypothetical protein ACA910_007410 [Epithemia clementina (nom. ined.)]
MTKSRPEQDVVAVVVVVDHDDDDNKNNRDQDCDVDVDNDGDVLEEGDASVSTLVLRALIASGCILYMVQVCSTNLAFPLL